MTKKFFSILEKNIKSGGETRFIKNVVLPNVSLVNQNEVSQLGTSKICRNLDMANGSIYNLTTGGTLSDEQPAEQPVPGAKSTAEGTEQPASTAKSTAEGTEQPAPAAAEAAPAAGEANPEQQVPGAEQPAAEAAPAAGEANPEQPVPGAEQPAAEAAPAAAEAAPAAEEANPEQQVPGAEQPAAEAAPAAGEANPEQPVPGAEQPAAEAAPAAAEAAPAAEEAKPVAEEAKPAVGETTPVAAEAEAAHENDTEVAQSSNIEINETMASSAKKTLQKEDLFTNDIEDIRNLIERLEHIKATLEPRPESRVKPVEFAALEPAAVPASADNNANGATKESADEESADVPASAASATANESAASATANESAANKPAADPASATKESAADPASAASATANKSAASATANDDADNTPADAAADINANGAAHDTNPGGARSSHLGGGGGEKAWNALGKVIRTKMKGDGEAVQHEDASEIFKKAKERIDQIVTKLKDCKNELKANKKINKDKLDYIEKLLKLSKKIKGLYEGTAFEKFANIVLNPNDKVYKEINKAYVRTGHKVKEVGTVAAKGVGIGAAATVAVPLAVTAGGIGAVTAPIVAPIAAAAKWYTKDRPLPRGSTTGMNNVRERTQETEQVGGDGFKMPKRKGRTNFLPQFLKRDKKEEAVSTEEAAPAAEEAPASKEANPQQPAPGATSPVPAAPPPPSDGKDDDGKDNDVKNLTQDKLDKLINYLNEFILHLEALNEALINDASTNIPEKKSTTFPTFPTASSSGIQQNDSDDQNSLLNTMNSVERNYKDSGNDNTTDILTKTTMIIYDILMISIIILCIVVYILFIINMLKFLYQCFLEVGNSQHNNMPTGGTFRYKLLGYIVYINNCNLPSLFSSFNSVTTPSSTFMRLSTVLTSYFAQKAWQESEHDTFQNIFGELENKIAIPKTPQEKGEDRLKAWEDSQGRPIEDSEREAQRKNFIDEETANANAKYEENKGYKEPKFNIFLCIRLIFICIKLFITLITIILISILTLILLAVVSKMANMDKIEISIIMNQDLFYLLLKLLVLSIIYIFITLILYKLVFVKVYNKYFNAYLNIIAIDLELNRIKLNDETDLFDKELANHLDINIDNDSLIENRLVDILNDTDVQNATKEKYIIIYMLLKYLYSYNKNKVTYLSYYNYFLGDTFAGGHRNVSLELNIEKNNITTFYSLIPNKHRTTPIKFFKFGDIKNIIDIQKAENIRQTVNTRISRLNTFISQANSYFDDDNFIVELGWYMLLNIILGTIFMSILGMLISQEVSSNDFKIMDFIDMKKI